MSNYRRVTTKEINLSQNYFYKGKSGFKKVCKISPDKINGEIQVHIRSEGKDIIILTPLSELYIKE